MKDRFKRGIARFRELFKAEPEFISFAPGRVNLIGEHTDYNGGYVLPVAIEKGVWIIGRRMGEKPIRLFSSLYNEWYEGDKSRGTETSEPRWANYCLAVLHQLRMRGLKPGSIEALVEGDVPIGAGLASSAALEVSFARALQAAYELPFTDEQLVYLCQAAEHSDLVGVHCGIMDQFVAVKGRSGYALLIDCFDFSSHYVPFANDEISLLLVDTQVRRELADSEYNARRQQCIEALHLLQGLSGEEYPTLRHVAEDIWKNKRDKLPQVLQRRVGHVLAENKRVLAAMGALENKNWRQLGELLYASHQSLREEYEVSCPELDFLVEESQKHWEVFGARLIGAGFGGCVLLLMEAEAVDTVADALTKRYGEVFGRQGEAIKVRPAGAAQLLWLKEQ